MKASLWPAILSTVWLFCAAGCQPADYHRQADGVAHGIIDRAQKQAMGRIEPFTIEQPADALRRKLLLDQKLPYASPASLGTNDLEPIAHWPEKARRPSPGEPAQAPWEKKHPLVLTLADALQVAARNNRDYQARKEDVFRAALALDLEANQFRNILSGQGEAEYSADYSGRESVRSLVDTGTASWQRRLKNGASLAAGFAIDLARLLTQDRASSLGLFADATITVPLLRGSGRHVVTEPLTQAERDVVYSLYAFVRFRQTLAVRVASEYLAVLQQLDQVKNAEDNYRHLIISTRRARRMSDESRLSQIQVDQAFQDELRARDRWVSAQQSYAHRLDSFKITLALPADANIDLDRDELERLAQAAGMGRGTQPATQPAGPTSMPASAPAADAPVELVQPDRQGGGPLEMEAQKAIPLALERRLDLRTAMGGVYDAQRKVVVAADALGAELTLTASGSAGGRRGTGSAGQPDAQLRPEKGVYAAGLLLDLPLERTAERNAYRNSFIALERATRDVQELEDQIKLQIRDALRNLLQARESSSIQAQAVALAQRRVESTELFLETGRAQIRDVLEAQEALVSAKNSLTAARVNYRVAELELQRDMGLLEVDEKGNWHEYEP
jgi:hypothetical protein